MLKFVNGVESFSISVYSFFSQNEYHEGTKYLNLRMKIIFKR
jgi:hypothetical protein